MITDHFDVIFTYLSTGGLEGPAYQKKWGHFDVKLISQKLRHFTVLIFITLEVIIAVSFGEKKTLFNFIFYVVNVTLT